MNAFLRALVVACALMLALPAAAGPPPGDRIVAPDVQLIEDAREAAAAGDTQAAMALYKNLLMNHPTSSHVPAAFMEIGDIFKGRGETETALKLYEKALQFPDLKDKHPLLLKIARSRLDADNATGVLQTLIPLLREGDKAASRIRTEALVLSAIAYAQVGDPQKAVPFFQRLCPDPGELADVVGLLQRAYNDQGQPEAAKVVQDRFEALKTGDFP